MRPKPLMPTRTGIVLLPLETTLFRPRRATVARGAGVTIARGCDLFSLYHRTRRNRVTFRRATPGQQSPPPARATRPAAPPAVGRPRPPPRPRRRRAALCRPPLWPSTARRARTPV